MDERVAKAWAEAPDLPSLAAVFAADGRPPVTLDQLVAKVRSLRAAGKPVPEKYLLARTSSPPKPPPPAPKPPGPPSDEELRSLWAGSASTGDFRTRVLALVLGRTGRVAGADLVDRWVAAARDRGVEFPAGRPCGPAAAPSPRPTPPWKRKREREVLTDDVVASAWADSHTLADLRERLRPLLGHPDHAPPLNYLARRVKALVRAGLSPPRRLRGQARLALVPPGVFLRLWAEAGTVDGALAAVNGLLRQVGKKPVGRGAVAQFATALRKRGFPLVKVYRSPADPRLAARHRKVAELWREAGSTREFRESLGRWYAETSGRAVSRERLRQFVDAAKLAGHDFPSRPRVSKVAKAPKPPWDAAVPPDRLVELWARSDSPAAFRRAASEAYGRPLTKVAVDQLLYRRRAEGWYFAPKATAVFVAGGVVAAVWRECPRIGLDEVNARLAMVGLPPLDRKGLNAVLARVRQSGRVRTKEVGE